jgi:transposase
MERRGEAADRRGESFGSGAGVGDGAPEWASNQLLFFWRKAYREGRLGDVAAFVPAVVAPEPPEKGAGAGCGRIEIIIANGRRVIVDGDVDVEPLLRLIRGLETLP